MRTLLDINRYLNLSEPLMVELMKSQYQQSFTGNHQTDELIQRIDQAGKLSELPEKAFDNLMNYRGKQLNFNEKTIESLKKIEKKATLTEQEKSSLAYEIASNPHHISQLPQESKKNVDETFSNKNEEMKKFFELIEPEKLSSHVKSELPIYEQLLSRIENGQKPSDHELQKLDILHDELVRYNMLDAMPNRAQSFLENYQTEQELKQKAPHNAYQLLQKLKSGEQLKPFQAFYLKRYMPNEKQETHPIYGVTNFYKEINKTLENLPQDVRDKASEVQELTNPELLNVLEDVIEQIRAEENRLSNEEIYVPSLNAYIKLTSDFMEVRPINKKDLKKILTDSNIDKLLDSSQNFQLAGNIFEFHEGVDFSAYGTHDGTLTYQYGFNTQATKAIVFDTKTYGNPKKNYITIFEYHPAHGALLTTFYHVQEIYVSAGKKLQQGDVIGTYMIVDENTTEAQETGSALAQKEHVHIERRLADKGEFLKFITKDKKIDFDAFKNAQNDNNITNDIKFQLVQPMLAGDEYHAIALFTPRSALNTEFINQLQDKWLADIKSLKLHNSNFETPNDVRAFLKNSVARDILKLETIVEILQKLKVLLNQMGESNTDMDNVIQSAKQTALDLHANKLPNQFKLIY